MLQSLWRVMHRENHETMQTDIIQLCAILLEIIQKFCNYKFTQNKLKGLGLDEIIPYQFTAEQQHLTAIPEEVVKLLNQALRNTQPSGQYANSVHVQQLAEYFYKLDLSF